MLRKEKNGIVYFEFEHLAKTELVDHCFSTRMGGISKPPYDTMNLAYHMGDSKADVDENFRLLCEAVGFDYQKIVMTDQIHGQNAHVVENLTKPEVADGLITGISGFVLTSYYADCVPIFILDPVKKVIATVHAGWRGVATDVMGKAIVKMMRTFDCQIKDLLVGIGPAISMNHFEVGKEVADEIWSHMTSSEACRIQKPEDKWQLDLSKIIYERLIRFGVLEKNIEVSDLCTFANPELFFSHRRDGVARGNMAAMIALR